MKLNRNAFVLIVMLGLFCFGVGIACFGVCNTGIAYAIPGETQTVVLNWNGTFESEYGASISSDITATFDAQPEMVDVEIEGLGELSESSDAGVYVLTAKSSDPTYVFSNPTHLYTINPKAVNVVWGGTFESEYGESIQSDITATFDKQPESVNIEIDGLNELSATSNADAYILTASIDSQNYTLTNATHIYTIKPKTMAVVWDGAFESEYGDAISGFTAKYNGIEATISGKPTQNSDAGSYVLTASIDNTNYILTNTTHTYTIKPKAATVVWDGTFESEYGAPISSFTAKYNGVEATITGQPTNASDAGSYVLTASIDSKNYILTNVTHTYTISPKTVSVIWGGTFESEYGESVSDSITATFDGKPESVNIEIDRLSELSAGTVVGVYILTASIDSQNYTLTNATHIYTIKPKTMTVVWDGAFESEYGDAISGFTAKYNGVDATISGQPTQNSDAGSYVLTASTDNNNYTLINASHIYTIKPKAITVVWNGVFESKYGSKIEDISAALAQAPQGLNITIEGLNQLSESAKVGTYILKAEVNNKNYTLINATAAYTILDTTAENQLKDKANTNIVLIVVLALLGAMAVVAIVIVVIAYKKKIDDGDGGGLPDKKENEPTWKDLYKLAINLEEDSTPVEGEVEMPFYGYVRKVAETFKKGIVVHSKEMSIVEGKTRFNPIYHETVNEKDEPISGNVVLKVVEPGMTIDGHVVVKAKVKR